MLVKETAIAELRKIISSLDKILLDKSRFENALYDCFDKPLDVYSLMAGFGFFATLPKKPKVDAAASQIAKKSKISKEEARLVSEIWIAARFAGVKDADAAEVVKNKSPQRVAASVRPTQTLKQDAADKRKSASRAAKEAAATKDKADKSKSVKQETLSVSILADPTKPAASRIFYAGDTDAKQETEPKKSAKTPAKSVKTTAPAGETAEAEKKNEPEADEQILKRARVNKYGYTSLALGLMIAVFSLGLGGILTASYFAFRWEGTVAGMLTFGLGYPAVAVLIYAIADRLLKVRYPLAVAACATPAVLFFLLGLYLACAATLAPYGMANAAWVFGIPVITGLMLFHTLEGSGRQVTAAILAFFPAVALAALGYLCASGAMLRLTGVDGFGLLWMGTAYALATLILFVAGKRFYHRDTVPFACLLVVCVPVLLIAAQFFASAHAVLVYAENFYWYYGAALLLLVTSAVSYRRYLADSPLLGAGKLATVFVFSALAMLGLYALLYLACREALSLLACVLAFALTVALQFLSAFALARLARRLRQRREEPRAQ